MVVKGGGNPLRQGLIDRTLGGKTAVAIAWAAPEHAHFAPLELTFLTERGKGMPADRARIVLPCPYQRYHTRLAGRSTSRTILGEGGEAPGPFQDRRQSV